MHDVTENAVLILSAGHGNEQSLVALHDLDVVYSEHVIHCHGHNSTKTAFGDDLADFNVCDFHGLTSLCCSSGGTVLRLNG